MGVIDLDARVKKLEQGGGSGGAVIDQIEADLTALEEQINGDGETDLGLAGDVAELQAAAVPVKTEVTTLSTGTPITIGAAGGVYYEVLGNLVHVHAAVSGLTAATHNVITTLPADIRPATNIYFMAPSAVSTGIFAQVMIGADGTVDIYPMTGGTEALFDGCYLINAETPTT